MISQPTKVMGFATLSTHYRSFIDTLAALVKRFYLWKYEHSLLPVRVLTKLISDPMSFMVFHNWYNRIQGYIILWPSPCEADYFNQRNALFPDIPFEGNSCAKQWNHEKIPRARRKVVHKNPFSRPYSTCHTATVPHSRVWQK